MRILLNVIFKLFSAFYHNWSFHSWNTAGLSELSLNKRGGVGYVSEGQRTHQAVPRGPHQASWVDSKRWPGSQCKGRCEDMGGPLSSWYCSMLLKQLMRSFVSVCVCVGSRWPLHGCMLWKGARVWSRQCLNRSEGCFVAFVCWEVMLWEVLEKLLRSHVARWEGV